MISRKPLFFIIILFSLLLAKNVSAQDYECITTDPATGQITINWDWTSIYPQIDHYEIMYGLAFNAWIDSTGLASAVPPMSYVLPSANGNSDKYIILLRAVSIIPGNNREVTLSNIYLTVTQNTSSIAVLNWNSPISVTVLPGPCNFIVQRFDNGSWKTLATLPYDIHNLLTQYNDTLTSHCTLSLVDYRIQFSMQGVPCLSTSNTASGPFHDGTQPLNPTNDTISVYNDSTGIYPVIGWTPSPSPDVAGYIIYRFNGSSFPSIDTIPGDSTIFIDRTIQACGQSSQYAIAAIDSCDNVSPGTFLTAPRSIVLDIPDISPCNRKAYLSWNAYTNMPGGLGGYTVYRQTNFGSIVTVATVTNTETTYTDSTLFINGNSYTYYVKAFSGSGEGSSSSCRVNKVYYGPVVPDTIYLEQVTVVNDSYVEARYYYSPLNRVRQMVLQRSDSPAGPFSPVDTLSSNGTNFLPQEYFLSDATADVHHQSYYYRLAMIDSCNQLAMFSENIAQTILLACSASGATLNSISWNDYGTWYEGVERYDLFRLVNGIQDPPGPLASGALNQYTDDISALSPGVQTCYFVKAFENPGNPVIPDAVSTSNQACAVRDAQLFMPTAFRPDGVNFRFRPVQTYVITGSFNMQVFNKWGQMIFETKDIFNGWDGIANGSPAPADVYIYRVSYQSMLGESYEKRGAFTLVR